MSSRRNRPRTRGITVLAVAAPLSLAMTASALVASPAASGARGNDSPEVEARVKPIIERGGQEFRDLNGNGRVDPYENWHLPAEVRAKDLVRRMTMEEKAGLMQITSERRGSSEGEIHDPNPDTVGYVQDRHLRYLVIRDNPTAHELADRNNDYQEIAEGSRLGIPIVFTSNPRNHINEDLEFGISEAAGQFSTWPGSLGLAAAHDPELVREFAEIARAEWRSAGIRKIYGYQIETAAEPRWRRISGTFGESPDLNADIARELVLGFQGEQLDSESVAQTVKHFPGDGAVLRGLDPHNEEGQWAVYPTPGSLADYHLPPFQAAVDAGTSSIMSYYNVPSNALSADQIPMDWWQSEDQQFEEVAAAYNKTILTDLLRGEMGFTGYVNSDSGVLTNRDWGVQDLSIEEKFTKAIDAGTNLFSDNNDPSGLISAVNTGLVSESDLDPSVTMLLTEMFTLGLFEQPYVDPDEAQEIADSDQAQSVADEAHRKSIVLMRNDSDQLPLTDETAASTNVYVEVFNGEDSAAQTEALKTLASRCGNGLPFVVVTGSLRNTRGFFPNRGGHGGLCTGDCGADRLFTLARPGGNRWQLVAIPSDALAYYLCRAPTRSRQDPVLTRVGTHQTAHVG